MALSGPLFDRGDVPRWAVSFALVLGLHMAVLGAVAAYKTASIEPGEALPAVMIDMAPPAAAPNVAPANAPPQEEIPEAAVPEPVLDAAPDVPEPDVTPPEPVVTAEAPTPRAPPLEPIVPPTPVVEESAAVALPPPPPKLAPSPARKAEKKPEVKKPPKPVQAKRGEEQQEARRPAQRAAGAQTTASIPLASSGSSAASRASWQGALVAALNRAKRPQSESGLASVRFSIDRGGHVLSAGLAGPSGVASLDGEAVALVRRANLPPAPPDVPGGPFTFTVPIRFTTR